MTLFILSDVSIILFFLYVSVLGNGQNWAKDLKSGDFELICPNSPDTTFKYTEFENCNLAKVPVHAVIAREDARSTVVSFLTDVQVSFYSSMYVHGVLIF